ncbi:uncharacterized protein LAJ45_11587 [Morchella importuna]|nr:uncharacterized protein LAJ45_11587 [Morchella importuna]KAH8144419.1 hypothetical protein LAJ45_11587 [Morchella importuna]
MNFRMQTFILIMSLLCVAFVEAQYLDTSNAELQRRDGETSAAMERLCRMTSQQSAIINNTLYLMGGSVVYGSDSTWKDRSSQIAAPNTYLRAIDLTQDFNLSDGFLHTHRYDIPSDVPDIAEGHLWADEDRLVLVGGLSERVNKTFPNYTAPTASYEVWSYDLGSKDDRIWKTLSMRGGNKIMRAFNAAGTYVANLRKGFLLGGMVAHDSQSTVPLSMGDVDVGGLLIWDGAKESWENKSTPWKRRHSAGGFYLPYGEQGILAFFGGLTEEGNKLAYDNLTFPMNKIDIYDIAKDEWYHQNTTGNIPSHRANFCGQVASAPDNSSHQIYIFGGTGANSLLSSDVY